MIALLTLPFFSPFAAHADIRIGAGSSVHFADATVDLGCGNIDITGTADTSVGKLTDIASFALDQGAFSLGTGVLALGGDFANAGSFTPGSGSVTVVDACGNGISNFSGASNFYALSITTGSGKRVVFPVGLTQNVANGLTLQGAAGNLLLVASSAVAQQGLLALAAGAEQNIAYVDARDNRASVTPIAPGAPSAYQSIDSGDLTHWFDVSGGDTGGGNVPVSTPALSHFALLLLAALMVLFGWRGDAPSRGRKKYADR